MTIQFAFKTYILGSHHSFSWPHFSPNILLVPDCHGKPTHRFGSVDGAHHVWKTLIQKCNTTSIEFESSFEQPSWNWLDLVLLEDTQPLVDAHATGIKALESDGIFGDSVSLTVWINPFGLFCNFGVQNKCEALPSGTVWLQSSKIIGIRCTMDVAGRGSPGNLFPCRYWHQVNGSSFAQLAVCANKLNKGSCVAESVKARDRHSVTHLMLIRVLVKRHDHKPKRIVCKHMFSCMKWHEHIWTGSFNCDRSLTQIDLFAMLEYLIWILSMSFIIHCELAVASLCDLPLSWHFLLSCSSLR